MKKVFIILSLVAIIATVSSCKQKRCACTTYRQGYRTTHSLEPKTGKSCIDTIVWDAADSSGDLIKTICAEEEQ